METKHTSTPWNVRYGGGQDDDGFCIASRITNKVVCEYWPPSRQDYRQADAAFIVRACNSHADLVAALEEIIDYWGKPIRLDADARTVAKISAETREAMRDIARAALAKAKQS